MEMYVAPVAMAFRASQLPRGATSLHVHFSVGDYSRPFERCGASRSSSTTFALAPLCRPGGSCGPSLLCIPCHSVYIWVVAQPHRCGPASHSFLIPLLWGGRFIIFFFSAGFVWVVVVASLLVYISLAGLHACVQQQLSLFPLGGSLLFSSTCVPRLWFVREMPQSNLCPPLCPRAEEATEARAVLGGMCGYLKDVVDRMLNE